MSIQFHFQIYDYAQYYLDLAEANRKIEQNDNDDPIIDIGDGLRQPPSPVNDQALLAASSLTSSQAMGGGLGGHMRSPTQNGLWRVEYNFTSLYEVSDITPLSMEAIMGKLRANQTWFDAYFRTNMVNYEAPWVCEGMCRAVQTCAINHVDYSQYAYCVDEAASEAGHGREAAINSGNLLSGYSSLCCFFLLLMSFTH